MASTPSHAETNSINLEAVASYLVSNSFLLTGLELFQECAEQGRQDIPQALKDAFSTSKLDELLAQEDVAAVVTQARTASASRPPEDAGRIALLEYELRQERNNLQVLRGEMSSVLAFHSSKQKGKEPANKAGGKDLKKEPASPTEKRILNFLVKKYLVDQGYHLTAISLSSEVCIDARKSILFFESDGGNISCGFPRAPFQGLC